MPVATNLPRKPARKALCIGIEYIQLSQTYPDNRLRGSFKDTARLTDLLKDTYGYSQDDITLLSDEPGSGARLPTRANIIAAIHDLVKDAVAGDHLLFHYSGHGSQVIAPPDHTNEIDGYDEIIWPSDIIFRPDIPDANGDPTPQNYIVDDEMHEILVDKLPPGVRLIILLDCCSSGTGVDLPFNSGASAFSSPVDGRNFFSTPLRKPSIGRMQHSARGTMAPTGSVAITPMPSQVLPQWNGGADKSPFVTSWSACTDSQLTLEDKSGGVFLKAFTDVLRKRPRLTHAELLTGVTKWIADNVHSDLWQSSKPQLGSNRDIKSFSNSPFEL